MSTLPTIDQLNAELDKLASVHAGPFPVISLYLDLRPNERGRDQFEPFLRKELADRVNTFPLRSPERQNLERDAEHIRQYVQDLDPALNGLAVFACSAADLFEAVPLATPIGEHRLYISNQPHLYPLARLLHQYPRYLVLLADTHSARIVVFALNAVERTDRIESLKTRRHKMGGWAQARYQRHLDNYHLHHAKEVVDAVARIVREESIDTIVLSGDEVILPLLRDQLPKDLAHRIVETARLDVDLPEQEVLRATIAALREQDSISDRERVQQLTDAYRANGLACVGIDAVRRAFELGQVDELVVPANADTLAVATAPELARAAADKSSAENLIEELILEARHTSAKVRFIEDGSLLEPIGGVGAFLRFKL
jgi:peptide subunit release factor 1 (eRF1)